VKDREIAMNPTQKTVVIDYFVNDRLTFNDDVTVVAVDVIRATSTAVTAVAKGRQCFPVSSLEEAMSLAEKLPNPLLVGELGGNMPYGFHLQNSPAQLESRTDIDRPMILLSSSGTRLITDFRYHDLHVACLRNIRATSEHLLARHPKVALIGAGTRGEFREEDQLCCAWIAERLMRQGYQPESEMTQQMVDRWSSAPIDIIREGKSAEYLHRSGQSQDLDFILSHIDDLDCVFHLENNQLKSELSDTPSPRTG